MKKVNVLFFLLLGAIILSGCAGNLYTHTKKDSACVKDNQECKGTYNGVLYRPLVKYKETYTQDRILNLKGEVTHFLSGAGDKACVPITVTEEKLIPDPDNQYVVQYDPAFFETSTFTVKLSAQGTLSEVGTSSTPGGKSLVDSLTGLATTIKTLNHGVAMTSDNEGKGNSPLCSHGKVFLSQ